MKTLVLNADELPQLTYIYDTKAQVVAAAAVLAAAATQQMDLTNSNVLATNNTHAILENNSQQHHHHQQQQQQQQQQHLELPSAAHLMSLQTYFNNKQPRIVSNLNVSNSNPSHYQLQPTQPAQISPTALLPIHQLQLKQPHRQQTESASIPTTVSNVNGKCVAQQQQQTSSSQNNHSTQHQQQQQHHHQIHQHHHQQRSHPHQHHPYYSNNGNSIAAHQQHTLLHVINASSNARFQSQNHNHHLMQQQQQHLQQQYSHLTNNSDNERKLSMGNANGTANLTLTNRIKQKQLAHHHQQQQQQQQQHNQQYQQQQQHKSQIQTHQQHNIPVHALNQNSNFSAASSSTGGGTISSHAPTQQSNTTGSSLSPPAAVTVNPRTTNSHGHHAYANKTSTTAALIVNNNNNNNNTNSSNINNSNTVNSSSPTSLNTTNSNCNNTNIAAAATTTTTTTTTQINNNNHNNTNHTASPTTSAVIRSSGIAIPTAPQATTSAHSTSGSSPANVKKIKTEPVLSQVYQSERFSFASGHLSWTEKHWKRLLLQDERKFNLDGPDGYSSYYHDLRNQERILSQRPRGISVFVYILITSSGPLHLEVSTSKLSSASVIDIITRQRVNIATKLGGSSEFFLQDLNWSVSTMPDTQDRLNAEGIKTSKWPVIAHDINITENIWGWLIREVYDGGRKFSRKDDLIFRIREAFTRLPIDLVTNLFSTLPERMMELFQTNGAYTNC